MDLLSKRLIFADAFLGIEVLAAQSYEDLIERFRKNPGDNGAITELIVRWQRIAKGVVKRKYSKFDDSRVNDAVAGAVGPLGAGLRNPETIKKMIAIYDDNLKKGGKSLADNSLSKLAIRSALNQAASIHRKLQKESPVGEGGAADEDKGRTVEETASAPAEVADAETRKIQEESFHEHVEKLAEVMKEIKAVVDDIPSKVTKPLDKINFKDFYIKEVMNYSSAEAFDKDVAHLQSLSQDKYEFDHAKQALKDAAEVFKRIQGAVRAEGGESREKKLFKLVFKDANPEEMEQAVRDFQCINTFSQNINAQRQKLRKQYMEKGEPKTKEELTNEATKYVMENTVPKEIERSKAKGQVPKYCDLNLLLNPDSPESKKRIERAMATGGESPQKLYNSYTDTMNKFRPSLKKLVTVFGESLVKGLSLFKMKELIQQIRSALLETLGFARFAELVPSMCLTLSKRNVD